MTGRNLASRKNHVERDIRVCEIHGRTEFAASVGGSNQSKQWRCMACSADKQREIYQAKKEGTFIRVRGENKKTSERQMRFCSIHFLALSALGVCDECD